MKVSNSYHQFYLYVYSFCILPLIVAGFIAMILIQDRLTFLSSTSIVYSIFSCVFHSILVLMVYLNVMLISIFSVMVGPRGMYGTNSDELSTFIHKLR